MDRAERDYEPIQPRGTDWRGLLRKSRRRSSSCSGCSRSSARSRSSAAIFVAFGGYALIWGWKFALGVVLLIFVHEMGHCLEATRERLNPSWPVFIPFLGAYVKHTRGNPWQTARVAIAGPILGGVGALACYVVGRADGSDLLVALAYFGFVLNLFNLLPFGILDGGVGLALDALALVRRRPRQGDRLRRALRGTAICLAIGAFEAYLPQHRL